MALSEIDSFVLKFKNLLHSEKDAKLSFKSEAGKVEVVLSVELGHVQFAPIPPQRYPRNSPSRQRRRERRAAARNSEEEKKKEGVATKADESTDKPAENVVGASKESPDSFTAVEVVNEPGDKVMNV
jgi:hypothetical protein